MNSNHSIQLIVVIGIVGISALYMLGKIAPRWRINAAQHLQQTRYPAWINALGLRLSGSAGCGSGCDTCGSCTTTPNKKAPSTSSSAAR